MKNNAFTLVELLVVIATIAVLAGLLLPNLSIAKRKAQSIACENNLKTLQLASELYTDDNRGYFPPNRETVLGGFLQSIEGAWVLGNAKRDTTDENLRRGVLWAYVGAARPYKCPADRSTVRGHPQLARFRSYTQEELLNNYVLNGLSGGTGQWVAPFDTPLDLQAPAVANIFAFACSNEGTIEDGEFAFSGDIDDPDVFGWWMLPGERHSKGANFSFLDGHVEHHTWLFTPKPVRIGSIGPIGYWALNDADREDLRWVVQHTPYWFWDQRKGPKFPP
jgi:prepilin-type processing-associated H-X9-DG protein/prepilin-type N-terminal cleavage/methylation domain-containing protein